MSGYSGHAVSQPNKCVALIIESKIGDTTLIYTSKYRKQRFIIEILLSIYSESIEFRML